MRDTITRRPSWLLCLPLALALPALAQEQRGFYTGAGAGFTAITDDTAFELVHTLDSDDPVTAFGGFRFNESFGVEGFYADFKPDSLTASDESNLYTRSYQGSGLAADTRSTLAGVSAIATLTEEGPVQPFARAGLHYYDLERAGATSGDSLLLGAGAHIELTKRWNARVEWERYADVDRQDRNVFSAHFLYRFRR